jgi:dGTPase
LGDQVGAWLAAEGRLPNGDIDARNVATITASAGLVHDLGNPPFGHAGELAMQNWFEDRFKSDETLAKTLGREDRKNSQETQDMLSFEGNAQTVRLLGKLQVLADFHGVNLTSATMATVMKYTAPSHSVDGSKHERSRPGFFLSESDLVSAIRSETGTGENRHPLAYLVEAADDIVYLTVDLEDGMKKKLYDWNFLEKEIRAFAGEEGSALLDRVISAARKMVEAGPLDGRELDEATAVGFRTFAIAESVAATVSAFKTRYDAIMAGNYHGELTRDESFAARPLLAACKKFGRKYVYTSTETLKLEVMGRRVLHGLMDLFWEGAKAGGPESLPKTFAGRMYALTSPNYRRVFERALEKRVLDDTYCRLQLVTDQVSGMTDSFASSLHGQLTNA